ncbi:MAG TPA: DUF1259 domain-containing protein [Gemmatimonadaceae bacterium]|nr:DUF1259 domain-containing protein [Gemmatimonadaceae bacterium]
MRSATYDVRPGAPKRPRRTLCLLVACTGAALALGACSGSDGGTAEARAQDATPPTRTAAQSIDWKKVDSAMGRSGTMQKDGAYRYSMPRSDLRVRLDGVVISPALALGSWLAMKPAGSGVMAMGDLVLTQDEVPAVIAALRKGGVMQTALHNHLLRESPHVMYLHVHGDGDAVAIARAVHQALAATATPPGAASSGQSASPAARQPLALDTAAIDRELGRHGSSSGGVYHVSVPRAQAVRMAGVEIPPSMGVATALNFQPTGGGKAAINGDFVMTADEVNAVIQALEESGIQVVAVHNHMLREEPRLFFLHFWANDDAVKLAHGLRGALDRMAVQRAP